MISIYSYEELSETVQNNIYEREIQTTAYNCYKIKFQQELLMENLSNYYDFHMKDHETISITDEEDNIDYVIKVTTDTCILIHVAIDSLDFQNDYNTIIHCFYNKFTQIYNNCVKDALEVEPDFAQYLQDIYFTEDGKKVKISIDN